ncbi:hypothetical protein PTTG_27725 [Puccinia triticina 1-1 BBBD Race 1]|uniref:Uncharacterized protein n=2 Tax=Puccinia triticina TaxID=208348 RepID=A0A180GHH8_PUCT1|nr:uncharacterized protein PtA15_3A294 [Puccinia triticina]OAV92140.1 hypothetical protein PTTG_27725 [Puccinia triticina 1-1 BBBD Race 1]WAQ82929.1 hypothetical protein PtA15_3A294 [Puccinia triticina]WAR53753.1 hypothetical protein PtB15_3B262 [Puccinia triticina]
MSTTRDSTPCPSPRPNDYRDRKGKGRAIPSPSFPSHETERSEIIKLLESRLNESHQLLAKLKRLSRQQQPQAPRNTKKFKNIFFSPALGNQPKIWASSSSSSHKRHCKLNNSKMQHFQERKSQGARPRGMSIFGSPSQANPAAADGPEPETEGTNSCIGDPTDVLSTSATIDTVQQSDEEQARILRESLLLPRIPELDEAINSWRSRVEN